MNTEDNYQLVQAIALITGNSAEAIESGEKAGQLSMINSFVLPKEGDWKTLELWGVIKKEENDSLFYNCELPLGWKIRPTKHSSCWSYLLDDQDRRRAAVFYKAAFYDRKAHFHVNVPRYRVSVDYSVYEEKKTVIGIEDIARDEFVWKSEPIVDPDIRGKKYDELRDAAEKEAEAKLQEMFPLLANNPRAYWD